MKAIFCALFLAVIGVASAQDDGAPQQGARGHGNFDPQERAQKTIEKFGERTILIPTVKDSLITIYVEFYNNVKQFRASQSGDGKNMFAAFEKTRDEKVKAVLDPNSYKEYVQFLADEKAEREKRMQQGEHGNYGGHGGGHGGWGGGQGGGGMNDGM